MASASEIKTRISSIRDTMKITKAMYMISSTKLTKARKTLESTEPFFYSMQDQIRRLFRHCPDLQHQAFDDHERHTKDQKTIGYIVITADKGMAGAYNHNVEKTAEKDIAESGQNAKLYVIGEVGRQYFYVRNVTIDHLFRYTAQDPNLARARRISEIMFEEYDNGEIDELHIVYTRMVNRMVSEVADVRLLPLSREKYQTEISPEVLASVQQEEFELNPSPYDLMENAVRVYVTGYIYGALVEAFASEQNARMQAMQSATDSAEAMLAELSIEYNRVRQAAITQEITEVIGGAKALKRKKQRLKDKQKMVN